LATHDVFVSYAREDRARAEHLVSALNEENCRVWWDDQINTGSKFDAILDQALNEAACVVVLWSERAVNSEWVKMEAQHGLAREHLLPVYIELVDLPQPFHRLQTADLTDWDNLQGDHPAFRRLVDDIFRMVKVRRNKEADGNSVSGFGSQPAIAILPLENRADDSDEAYLGDALAEDIISRLQAFRTLPVISSRSSFSYRDRSNDISAIAESLRVGYLVIGNVRKYGNRIRIGIELVDTSDGHLVWSEKFTREVDNIFDLQDEISLEIAGKIEPEIGQSERQKSLPRHESSLSTWQLLRRAQYHQYKLSEKDAGLARKYLDQALEQQPGSVDGLCIAAWQHFWDISAQHRGGSDWTRLESMAQHILTLDPKNAQALNLLGIATMMGGDPLTARAIFAESAKLNPSYSSAIANLGSTYYLCGEPAQGVALIEKALRLNPYDIYVFHAYGELAHCHFLLQDWEEALVAIGHSLRIRRYYWLAHILRVAILSRAGRIEEASGALEYFLTKRPGFSTHDINWIPYASGKQRQYLVESLALAGWSQ